jgi:hypothetical protein
MFPYQRMAIPLMPQAHQAAINYRCAVTWEICCDTGFSIVQCALSHGCAGYSEQSMLCPYAQVNAGDPVQQLQELRKHLEVTLAGVQAQERAVQEQARQAEESGKAGRK